MPPVFCASATTCSAIVVLPDDSGPKISKMRPRGKPPMPSADIHRDRSGRNHRNRHDRVFRTQPQDRAFAELLLDLAQGNAQCPCAFFFVHKGGFSVKSDYSRRAGVGERKTKTACPRLLPRPGTTLHLRSVIALARPHHQVPAILHPHRDGLVDAVRLQRFRPVKRLYWCRSSLAMFSKDWARSSTLNGKNACPPVSDEKYFSTLSPSVSIRVMLVEMV